MIRRFFAAIFLVTLGMPARAQEPLTLSDALARARRANLDVRAAATAERQAETRIAEARAGYLPAVDLSEGWQRGDQPVYVFGSLLSQRRFTAANFAIDSLNHPATLDNFRTALTVEQPVLAPSTPAEIRLAELGRDAAALSRAVVVQDLLVAVTEAYGRVLLAAAARRTAEAAMAAATEARTLAINRRDAGLTTDADVLQVDVHRARVAQRQIQADADERIARARLNHLMGEPLDTAFVLSAAAPSSEARAESTPALERAALEARPDVALAALNQQVAKAVHDRARASFLPRVVAHAGWEANGGSWGTRATAWIVGAEARINLFRGLGDRARAAAAREDMARRDLEREQAEASARLDVRVASARVDAARANLAAGQAAAAQARESHRIVRDRYEGGLSDMASLLGAVELVEEAEQNRLAADVELVTATAALDRALGKR